MHMNSEQRERRLQHTATYALIGDLTYIGRYRVWYINLASRFGAISTLQPIFVLSTSHSLQLDQFNGLIRLQFIRMRRYLAVQSAKSNEHHSGVGVARQLVLSRLICPRSVFFC